jgi:hypothetical protein
MKKAILETVLFTTLAVVLGFTAGLFIITLNHYLLEYQTFLSK